MLSQERQVLADIAEQLKDHPSVLQIIAYGSRIRGEERLDSDLDIFVVTAQRDRSLKDRIREVFYQYELAMGLSFSVMVLSQDEVEVNARLGSPFLKRIQVEGVTVYDAQSRGETRPFTVQAGEG